MKNPFKKQKDLHLSLDEKILLCQDLLEYNRLLSESYTKQTEYYKAKLKQADAIELAKLGAVPTPKVIAGTISESGDPVKEYSLDEEVYNNFCKLSNKMSYAKTSLSAYQKLAEDAVALFQGAMYEVPIEELGRYCKEKFGNR